MPEVSSVGRRKASRLTGRRRACDICFQRKIKCDAELPQCNWCKHHSLACTYDRIAGRIKSSGIHLLSDEGLEWIEHQVGEKVNRAELKCI
ncbi:hypothetical protein BJX96DRAFT_59613 [Aspergillus floccosus]